MNEVRLGRIKTTLQELNQRLTNIERWYNGDKNIFPGVEIFLARTSYIELQDLVNNKVNPNNNYDTGSSKTIKTW